MIPAHGLKPKGILVSGKARTTNQTNQPTSAPSLPTDEPRSDTNTWCSLRHVGNSGRWVFMWTDDYQTRCGPPTNRLWDDNDIAQYTGYRSIDELRARHPDFPRPVPLGMQGNRYRPTDVEAWINGLCSKASSKAQRQSQDGEAKTKPPVLAIPHDIPAFDPTVVSEALANVRHG